MQDDYQCLKSKAIGISQCNLENPWDSGAWWAAIYGVAQSRTRLKHLSSSSNLPWCWGSQSKPSS